MECLICCQFSQNKRTNAKLNTVTVALLSIVTTLALITKDLSFVLSFGGATLENALIYIFPDLIFRKAVRQMGDKAIAELKVESVLYQQLLRSII